MSKNVPDNYQPISMWGYFGYELLFNIPVIGWLILLIFALGGASNINVRNFARSKFCVFIIYVIIFALVALLGGSGALVEYISRAASSMG
ncbi:hypothetical protein SAMN02910456_01635 [Ruminococcaceae bacterium YRB3002]|nr:hypothetical protein SAMN02910456_01635 [Ruminococcaceae bacterium YRB3002]